MEVIEVEADGDFMEYYSIKEEFANIMRVLAQSGFKQGSTQEARASSEPLSTAEPPNYMSMHSDITGRVISAERTASETQRLVRDGERCVTGNTSIHDSYYDDDKSRITHVNNSDIYERFSVYNNPDDDEDTNEINNIIEMSNNGDGQGCQRGQMSLLQNYSFREDCNFTLNSQSDKENTTRGNGIEQTDHDVDWLDAYNQSIQGQSARQTTAVYKQKHSGKKHTFYLSS